MYMHSKKVTEVINDKPPRKRYRCGIGIVEGGGLTFVTALYL